MPVLLHAMALPYLVHGTTEYLCYFCYWYCINLPSLSQATSYSVRSPLGIALTRDQYVCSFCYWFCINLPSLSQLHKALVFLFVLLLLTRNQYVCSFCYWFCTNLPSMSQGTSFYVRSPLTNTEPVSLLFLLLVLHQLTQLVTRH